MKIEVADLDFACGYAKRIKPTAVRFHSRDKVLYTFFRNGPVLLGVQTAQIGTETIDITVDAIVFMTSVAGLPKSTKDVEMRFTSSAITMTQGKNVVDFKAQGEADELVHGIDDIFKMKGEPLDLALDIADSWPHFALLRDANFGWQFAYDESGYPLAAMTDRTIATIYSLERSVDKKLAGQIMATVPEEACDLIVQLVQAYRAAKKSKERGVKAETVLLPMITVSDKYVGYPFTDRVGMKIASKLAQSDIDTFAILKLLDVDSYDYELPIEPLQLIFKSVTGFNGQFIEIHADDNGLDMIFESSAARHSKKIGKALRKIEPRKFTVSYKGMVNIVNAIPKEAKVSMHMKVSGGKVKSLIIAHDKGAESLIICGV